MTRLEELQRDVEGQALMHRMLDQRAQDQRRLCGHVKPISGRKPLICARPAGHDGDHATHNQVGELLVRWGQQS